MNSVRLQIPFANIHRICWSYMEGCIIYTFKIPRGNVKSMAHQVWFVFVIRKEHGQCGSSSKMSAESRQT
jgi:hypothetical protein